MKKLLIYGILGVLSLGFASVDTVAAKGQPVVEDALPRVYEGTVLDMCITGYEAAEYELLAGQYIDAGTVTITTDGETFFVTVDGLSLISDVHVYVYGEGDLLPTKRPVPGQAPYKLENVFETSATLEIPVDGEETVTFAVHVSFVDVENDTTGVAGETAYAADQDASYSGKGAWFYLVSFTVVECEDVNEEAPTLYIAAHAALTNSETAWALGEFTFIETGISNKWGWFLSVDTYGTHTFDVYYGAGRNSLEAGTLIGTLTVEYSYDEVTVTLSLTGEGLTDYQVFVGYDYPTTSAPGQYDYKVEGLNGELEASITAILSDLQ